MNELKQKVVKIVADLFALPAEKLTSPFGGREVAKAKYLCFKICTDDLGMTRKQMVEFFNVSYCTVTDGIKTIREQCESNADVKILYQAAKNTLMCVDETAAELMGDDAFTVLFREYAILKTQHKTLLKEKADLIAENHLLKQAYGHKTHAA